MFWLEYNMYDNWNKAHKKKNSKITVFYLSWHMSIKFIIELPYQISSNVL